MVFVFDLHFGCLGTCSSHHVPNVNPGTDVPLDFTAGGLEIKPTALRPVA